MINLFAKKPHLFEIKAQIINYFSCNIEFYKTLLPLGRALFLIIQARYMFWQKRIFIWFIVASTVAKFCRKLNWKQFQFIWFSLPKRKYFSFLWLDGHRRSKLFFNISCKCFETRYYHYSNSWHWLPVELWHPVENIFLKKMEIK